MTEHVNKTKEPLWPYMLRLLWALTLGICGVILVASETSWKTAFGVFLMLWGNNHGALAKYKTTPAESVIRTIGRK